MDLKYLLSQMALELEDVETNEQTTEAIAHYARVAIDADDAGVMLVHARNRITTPGGTSDDVDRAHQLQAEFGEGPCLAAIDGGDHTYLVTNTVTDDRWDRWGKAAAELGYHSVVSSSLETRSRRWGSLNAYSRRVDAFSESDVEVVRLLAGHASVAIAAAQNRTDLSAALETRTMIGQAQGILMHAFGIDADQAFSYLKRLSQDQNVKLIKVAETIIENQPGINSRNAE